MTYIYRMWNTSHSYYKLTDMSTTYQNNSSRY